MERRWLLSNVFPVTNTLDDGSTGSLPWAIGQVNSDAADTTGNPDQITFAIPTSDAGFNAASGVWTIAPTTALPAIANPAVIDGYTQPGASPNTLADGDNAVLTIQLDGTNAGAADGLEVSGGNITVKGLSITHFGNGLHLVGPGDDSIAGNFVGVTPSGAAGNQTTGILIDNSPFNTIGGSVPTLAKSGVG